MLWRDRIVHFPCARVKRGAGGRLGRNVSVAAELRNCHFIIRVMTVAREFIDRELDAIRKEFFAGKTDRAFFQERNMLEQAICYPAKWLDERGSAMRSIDYGKILSTVIGTIREHGRKKEIKRVSAYLLHSVEEHMDHHGEEYYYAAKSVGSTVADAMQSIRRADPDANFVPVMAGVYQTLRSGQRGGRKKRFVRTCAQTELFSQGGGKA
jgi:hypothetical protein